MKVDSGSKLDLDLLLNSAKDGAVRAIKIGDDVYVDWETLRPHMPFGPASHAAERFLPVLNGMLALRFPAFVGLELKSLLGTSDEGKWIPVSWASFKVHGKDGVEHARKFLEDGGPMIGALYHLATSNAAVAEALLYFGRSKEPFFDLYKAFEVVRDTVGGAEPLQALGLASRNDCERFARSANDPAISGVFARHSQRFSAPIDNPMTEFDAREFVRNILVRWTGSLPA